ncbi:copper resistance protein B [Dyella sp. KULCS107]|uniref:copper resistance protein B n=1 Tax=Dyella sp. KULCS107 TaxID=3422216 RepID=UPI003D6F37DD
MSRKIAFPHIARTALGLALSLAVGAWVPTVAAQSTPSSSASTGEAQGMDMGAMPMGDMPMSAPASDADMPASQAMPTMDHATPGMEHAAHKGHAPASSSSTQGKPAMDHGAMPGMQHGDHHPAAASSMSGMNAMPGMEHATHEGHTPTSSSSTQGKPAMDHAAMPGMQHGDRHPAAASSVSNMDAMAGMQHAKHEDHAPASSSSTQGTPAMNHAAMPGMPHGDSHPAPATSGMSDMSAMPGMDQAAKGAGMPGMSMGAMQGGAAPAGARSPDYSDGYGHSTMPGMDMADSASIGMLLVDQLEAFHGRDGSGQAWELQGWYGGDADKLWLRSEGERSGGRLEDGDVEALWSHAVAAYWDTTLGVRHDLGDGPSRDWLAAGVQGLAPYWFDVEATLYLGTAGRSAARLRASYDLRFTQRLILQPELEANLYGRRDPARGLGRGLTDVQFGLRLRYEIRREFAPYVGVQFVQRVGATADLARTAGRAVFDRQFVAGLRIWF